MTFLCVFLVRLPNESPNKRCGPSDGGQALRREFAKARCAGLHACVGDIDGDAQVCMSALLSLAKIWIADAAIAQLGERQTEDLKVPGSIPGGGKLTFH